MQLLICVFVTRYLGSLIPKGFIFRTSRCLFAAVAEHEGKVVKTFKDRISCAVAHVA